MGEKPSSLPACAEASAGKGEDFSLIVGATPSPPEVWRKGFQGPRVQGKAYRVPSLSLFDPLDIKPSILAEGC